jgi:hypothetical protein
MISPPLRERVVSTALPFRARSLTQSRRLEVVEGWPLLGCLRSRLLLLRVNRGANPRGGRFRNLFQGNGNLLQFWLGLIERAICGRPDFGRYVDREGRQVFQRCLYLLRAPLRSLPVERGLDLGTPLSHSRGNCRDQIGGSLFEPRDIALQACRRGIVVRTWRSGSTQGGANVSRRRT